MSLFESSQPEKKDPFASLDGRKQSIHAGEGLVTVVTLKDADEALSFLENHPHAAQIAEEGNAILEDPQQLNRLVRKIDLTIAPLLACVYFLQFLDKTTLSYTAVMGIRTDTHLKGQDYSDLSMLFYIGRRSEEMTRTRADRLITRRFSGGGVSDAIPGAEDLAVGNLPWPQHYDMGVDPRVPCCLHHLCRVSSCPNTARRLRKLVRTHYFSLWLVCTDCIPALHRF